MKLKLNVALSMIKLTTEFELSQIEVRLVKDEIIITSLRSHKGSFINPELCMIAISINLSSYVAYNEETGNCELHIF